MIKNGVGINLSPPFQYKLVCAEAEARPAVCWERSRTVMLTVTVAKEVMSLDS